MTVFSQVLLIFLIFSVVVYYSHVSAEKRYVYGSLHCCERKCIGGNKMCNYLIQVATRNDRWECVTLYDETDYPIRMENGESWRPFWWYNATGGWPSHETDTLGAQFGLCNPAAHYCFGRLPQYRREDETELLAVDSAGNKFRWAFDSGNSTAHAVWLAFHDHQQTGYDEIRNSDHWAPIVVAGGPYQTQQDSFMYRREHGVVSFLLDDDNCDCLSTLNAGHAMCHDGFHSTYGLENVHGVGLLNEGGCNSTRFNGPSGENSLFLYYRGPDVMKPMRMRTTHVFDKKNAKITDHIPKLGTMMKETEHK